MDAKRKASSPDSLRDRRRAHDAAKDKAQTRKESLANKASRTSLSLEGAAKIESAQASSSESRLALPPAQLDSTTGTTGPPQELSRIHKARGKCGHSTNEGIVVEPGAVVPQSPERLSSSRRLKRKHSHAASTRLSQARGSEAGPPAAPSLSLDRAKRSSSKSSVDEVPSPNNKGKIAQSLPAETSCGAKNEHEHEHDHEVDTAATMDKSRGAANEAAARGIKDELEPSHAPHGNTTATALDIVADATTHVDKEHNSGHKTEIAADNAGEERGIVGEPKIKVVKSRTLQARTLNRGRDGTRNEAPAATAPKAQLVGRSRPERRSHNMDADHRSAVVYSTLKELATSLKTESTVPRTEAFQLSLTLQKLRCRIMSGLGTAVLVVLLVAVLVWLRGTNRTVRRASCDTVACVQLSRAFDGMLDYSAEPCDDMNAFVCSKMSTYTASAGGRTSPSLVAHFIREYQLKIVDMFLDGETTFKASEIVRDFLQGCTGAHKTHQSVSDFIEFFKFVSVRWPFDKTATPELHPLEAVLTLSIKMGVDTWFRAYINKASALAPGSSNDTALFIESSAQPTLWLDFVRTLGDRRNVYYEELHKLFNASLPGKRSEERLLAIEKSVLSILDAARTPGAAAGPTVTTIQKLVHVVSNSTIKNWLEPLRKTPGGAVMDGTTPVSVENVRVLWAIDDLLSTYSTDVLSEQLSWWLVQILTVIGWPKGYYVIAGSQEAAAIGVKVECYSVASGRFGLLMASESAVHEFTPQGRREAEAFLDYLLKFLIDSFDNTTWLNAETKAAVSKRLAGLELSVWPPIVADSDETLWKQFSNFCLSCQRSGANASNVPSTPETSANATTTTTEHPTLMDYWFYTSQLLWNTAATTLDGMQLRWHGDALEAMQYEPLSNRLRVSHAALLSPFYHPDASELQHANFGGLGAAFLAHVLYTFMPPDTDAEGLLAPSPWSNASDIVRQAESLKCPAEFVSNLADVVALELSWRALKNATAPAPDSKKRSVGRSQSTNFLSIRDADGETRVYTADQVFFLTYCLTRCGDYRRLPGQVHNGPDCNVAVRSVRAFADAFGCAAGKPMAREMCDISKLF